MSIMGTRHRDRIQASAGAAAGMALSVAFLLCLPPAGSSGDEGSMASYPVHEKREIRKSLVFSDTASSRDVSLDNIFGSIRVEGGNVTSAELEAVETILARTPEKLAQAKQDVRLEAASKGNSVEIYVDGPFRCRGEGGRGLNWHDRGYEVRYDFTLRVPRRTDLVLRTVSHGDIHVRGVEGRLEVHNVNGRIELSDVAGGIQAQTVNGRIQASFSRPPGEACGFKTINGDLELAFPQATTAVFQVRTTNGDVYSDFDVESLPGTVQTKSRRREGGFLYRSKGFARFQTGTGGPEITLETMNGDIVIGKVHRST